MLPLLAIKMAGNGKSNGKGRDPRVAILASLDAISEGITDKALMAADRLIWMIDFNRSPAPNIEPMPNGGVKMCWELEGRELELELLGDGHLCYLASTGETVVDGDLTNVDADDIALLVNWLLDGTPVPGFEPEE